jgi:hypothetical protein
VVRPRRGASTLSKELPTPGSSTDSGVRIADSLYAGGESYFVDWQDSTNIPSANGTYAFEVVPASVPEPAMILIFLVSLRGIGVN